MQKDTVKLAQLSTSFQINFEVFHKGFLFSSAHWFKGIDKSSVDSQFEANTLMLRYKQDHKVTNKIYFMR